MLKNGARLDKADDFVKRRVGPLVARAIPIRNWGDDTAPSWPKEGLKSPPNVIKSYLHVGTNDDVSRWYRLVEDIQQVWKRVLGTTVHVKGKAKASTRKLQPHPDPQLTSEDEAVVTSAIRAAPSAVTSNVRDGDIILFCCALACVLHYNSTAGLRIFEESKDFVELRTGLQELLQPYLLAETQFTFPDGLNVSEDLQVQDPPTVIEDANRSKARRTLLSAVKKVGRIKFDMINGPDEKPIPEIQEAVVDFLKVRGVTSPI